MEQDSLLIERVLEGDTTAFSELVKQVSEYHIQLPPKDDSVKRRC